MARKDVTIPDLGNFQDVPVLEVVVKVGEATLDGEVVQISDTPEFTPGTVQTDDERAQLVYQVRVRIHGSDRRVKPGMSATVEKHPGAAPRPAAPAGP